jgi:hypothetical protein
LIVVFSTAVAVAAATVTVAVVLAAVTIAAAIVTIAVAVTVITAVVIAAKAIAAATVASAATIIAAFSTAVCVDCCLAPPTESMILSARAKSMYVGYHSIVPKKIHYRTGNNPYGAVGFIQNKDTVQF